MASNDELVEAYRKALETDSVAAFGGIVAVNRELYGATAREIASTPTRRSWHRGSPTPPSGSSGETVLESRPSHRTR